MQSLTLPFNAPDDVRAWLIEIDLNASIDVASAGVLSEPELARARRYLRNVDAARYATVRAALRHILAVQMNEDAASLVIETDDHGRPMLAMPGAPDFNVSHSGAFGVIALSVERSVGIDIEEARASLEWRKLTPLVFADADRRAVDAMPEPAQCAAFFECWTAKEAVLKAHGTGMGAGAVRMDAFSVLPRGGERFTLSKEAGAFDVSALAPPPGYAASLAWSRATHR